MTADDERNEELEKNDLAEGLKKLAAKAKSGQLLSGRIIGIGVVVAVALGLWWYFSGSARTADADTWKTLDGLSGAEAFKEFAKTAPDSLPSKVARLQEARILLGPQGLNQLANRDALNRTKAIKSVEDAREMLVKLVDDFKNDLTLQGQVLDALGHAELALVGIPKEGGGDRGSIDKAVEYFRKFAKLVGEGSPLGEAAKVKADDLEKNKAEVLQVATDLNTRLTPPPLAIPPEIKLPPNLNGLPPAAPIPPPSLPSMTTPSK